jgi:hypothetical protein
VCTSFSDKFNLAGEQVYTYKQHCIHWVFGDVFDAQLFPRCICRLRCLSPNLWDGNGTANQLIVRWVECRKASGRFEWNECYSASVKFKKSLIASILFSCAVMPLGGSDAKAQVQPLKLVSAQSPVFPFGENGFCYQDCPSIGLRAVVDYLSISVVGQSSALPRATLNAGDAISILYLGLDNGGYSNWWEAKATLVSDTSGARASIGKGVSDDGNEFKAIRISCDRDFNKCSPSMVWRMLRVDASLAAGTYSLEVEFSPVSSSSLLPVVTHLFGPAVLTVNPKAQTPVVIPSAQSINGRACPKLGRVRIEQGVRYACISSGKKKIWRKMA